MIGARGDLPPGTRRRRWMLAAAGVMLAAALGSLVWMQSRQFMLLNQASQYTDDYLQISLGQLEAEYLRLQVAWLEARQQPVIDRERLQLRYDIFVSRIALVETERARRHLAAHAEYAVAVDGLRGFVTAADRVLGPNPAEPLTREALATLQPRLFELGPPLKTLVLEGMHRISANVSQRHAAVRDTSGHTIEIAAVLALATFGFAVLGLAQLRRLEQRRAALERMTVELAAARRDADAANVAKSAFLANMSHELRTPLQGVLGMITLLDPTRLDAEQRERLRTARDSADHLLAILNDILDLAKLEAGKLAIHPQPADLRKIVGDVVALMRAQTLAKGLTLASAVTPDVPAWLMADPTRLQQILLNLCSNAVKFTREGRVDVCVRREGDRLRLAVQDTGVGIDETTLSRLFQRFGRADDTRSRRHGGAGLGLEISRQLARLMGGDIEVLSQPGVGSTFVVDLPLAEAEAPAQPARAAVEPRPGGDGAGRLVLVADDNQVNRLITGALLERLGHRVIEAENGEQALAAAREHPVDLVLMDLHMPGMDGLDATRAIRRLDGGRARVPVIALTADAFAETRKECEAAGLDDFIAKPVEADVLAAVLERHLRRRVTMSPQAR